jgi:hypothetical protein
MLHLFTQTIAPNITRRYSLVMNSDAFPPSIPFYPPNTAGNQPATGWFLFQIMLPRIKKCVLCYDAVILTLKMYALN